MTTETVSLDFLVQQAKSDMEKMRLVRDEMRLVRKDLADMIRLVNASYEMTRRVERRHLELRDDIELMVKMELGGSLVNIQTSMESSMSKIEGSVGDIAKRLEALEDRP